MTGRLRSISKDATENKLALPPACCHSGMDEDELQAHRCEYSFGTIGECFAKLQGSPTKPE